MSNNEMNPPTAMEKYLFDLRGFIVIKNALSAEEVEACNAGIDQIIPIERGEWDGYVHAMPFDPKIGLQLQQIYEAGPAFETLVDHPSWYEKVKCFVGGEGSYDYLHGPLFIDENFANVRGPGEAIFLHSGAHEYVKRTQYLFRNGHFMCGQVNILIALTKIGPGDGATMVIPGSHKSNFEHPQFETHKHGGENLSADGVIEAIEVHMEPGDALCFVDALSHGSAERTNPGERRILVYRYGPSWGNFRYGYQPSPDLLARVTDRQRQLIQPLQPLTREPQKGID